MQAVRRVGWAAGCASLVAAGLLVVGTTPAGAGETQFDAAGFYAFTVPGGVDELSVVTCGAQGGPNATALEGGRGGRVSATVPVTSLEVLVATVGGVGGTGAFGTAGFNGGGTGGDIFPSPFGGGGAGSGGGATELRHGDGGVILVAGGGGGRGQSSGALVGGAGGAGGASGGDGGNGSSTSALHPVGPGGAQAGRTVALRAVVPVTAARAMEYSSPPRSTGVQEPAGVAAVGSSVAVAVVPPRARSPSG